jgi:two-component system sensor histidine kinase KdpD
LLASLTHDVNTPLTAIRTAVDNVGVTSLTDLQRAGQLDIARRGLDRLTRLFQNILEMARIDAGAVTPSLEWVHPSEIVQAARQQVELGLRAHRVKVMDHTNDWAVRTDPRLLSRVIAHVLENAAHYSPAGSTITVTLELVSGGLRVVVDDEGPGITPADMPRLFERFYRGSKAPSHPSGTGMGLAIVEGLVTALGGHVGIDNRPQSGARFSIFVPAAGRPGGHEL